MLPPFVTYLVKIDRKKWQAFTAILKKEGRTVKWAIEALIDRVIDRGGFDDKPKKG